MDRLQAMTTFVTVAETGGFSAAARKLDVSPSVVSRIVTELEEHLGVRLLTRTTRIVRLTETGATYFENCRRILGEIDEAEQSASGEHEAPRGVMTITAPVLFGALYVTPIVVEYLTRYPEVDMNCWFLDRVVNLVDEGIDVAVRIGELPNSSLQAIRVGTVRRVVCASPAYLERCGIPRTPDDLNAHTIISTSSASNSSEWRFTVERRIHALRVQPRMTSTSNDAAIAAAVRGFGIVRPLSYQIANQLRAGTLQVLLEEFEPPPLPIHVVHREGRHATQKVRAFLDLAIERLRTDPALNRIA
ncbi:LysR family transcriptional regulator [Paraburkholderia edwinii]|jgi:DNA-binding transcriptional LysR family regulator|uniref:LysR family transcriptional regulator n=1 Tax=Paraburkholderia edwinii TaxID=2861782 RepID=A0ABX8UW15_9BURK|nr:LysR family transcriptional regulator [Paraburkholderia edwinii]QYD73185.1 LysR family transcriptional regulator [Paraburkholderia edwinii]